jgi:hypothetical protein
MLLLEYRNKYSTEGFSAIFVSLKHTRCKLWVNHWLARSQKHCFYSPSHHSLLVSENKPPSVIVVLVGFYRHSKSPHLFSFIFHFMWRYNNYYWYYNVCLAFGNAWQKCQKAWASDTPVKFRKVPFWKFILQAFFIPRELLELLPFTSRQVSSAKCAKCARWIIVWNNSVPRKYTHEKRNCLGTGYPPSPQICASMDMATKFRWLPHVLGVE